MAAFTTFSHEQLERYVSMFGIGELAGFEPIEAGIENSNYFVTLTSGDEQFEFVLTITEDLGFEDTAFFNDLLSVLDRAGLPVPNPERTLDGMATTIFCGKPAWLFPRLRGAHPVEITVARCEAVGRALATLHLASRDARYRRDNPYSSRWAREVLAEKQHLLTDADSALLTETLARYEVLEQRNDLPRGIIHGDLFIDNAFFDGDTLTGIIDFYHACEDALVQDLAITLNAWTVDEQGSPQDDLVQALIRGYESQRPLEPAEREALPDFIRAGAARFVLTRLVSGEDGAHLKDPQEFVRILRRAADAP